jgi:putative ABC transport system ATP-binding protein
MGALLDVDGVSKTYRSRGVAVAALRSVSLQIDAGDFVALAGPSGSGKTTLLNLIGGLDKPTSGAIRLSGTDITTLSKRDLTDLRLYKIGFIFQDYNLIPVLSAHENVELVMLLQHVKASERAERARAALEAVGLGALLDRRPAELSSGQQQRVAVARAIVSRPQLVLADEPTANLDSETGAALIELLRTLNERDGITFVFAAHDPLIIERAKTVVRLKDGQVSSLIRHDAVGSPA